jgi:cobalt/nickel transport system permease protein
VIGGRAQPGCVVARERRVVLLPGKTLCWSAFGSLACVLREHDSGCLCHPLGVTRAFDRALSQVTRLDELARRESPLGRVEARAKVVALAVFLVGLMSFRPAELIAPVPLALLVVLGVVFGDVPLGLLVSRLLFTAPFALLVAIWNPVFHRTPELVMGPLTLSTGWLSFLSVVLRFVLGVSAVLVIVATTGMDALANALGRLGLPRLLTTQLLLLYRYVFVLGDEAARMLRAHHARAPTRPRPSLGIAGSMLGGLLLRSVARAERIHTAMLARGFDGMFAPTSTERFAVRDVVFLGAVVLFVALVRAFNLPRALGALFV